MSNLYINQIKSQNIIKWFFLLLILMNISCGGGSSPSNSTSNKLKVYGKITFERVPYTQNGLDFFNISELPVRKCLVKLFTEGSTDSLDSTYTDESGEYSFLVQKEITVYITIFSIATLPKITVEDNNGSFIPTNPEVYKMSSEPFLITEEKRIDLLADCGNPEKGNKYKKERLASPFAIIDTCQKSSKFFLDKRPGIEFPDLLIYWSIFNSEDIGLGTGWLKEAEAIFLLGDETSNTDEFDESVIVHEWGHFFQEKFSKSSTVFGYHRFSVSILDPSFAFSEGWGNALSAMVLYPNTNFVNTGALGEPAIYFPDIDENNDPLLLNPDYKMGWFSETSVHNILFDLFDPIENDSDEPWDEISLDAGEIFDIMSIDIASSYYQPNLFTFISGLKTRHPELSQKIDALLAKHDIDPIDDPFGSDETNSGGVKGALPIYNTYINNEVLELEFDVATVGNELANNRLIKLVNLEGTFLLTFDGAKVESYCEVFEDGEEQFSLFDLSTPQEYIFDASKTYIFRLNYAGDGEILSQGGTVLFSLEKL